MLLLGMLLLHSWPILLKSLLNFYARYFWERYRYYNRLRCERPHGFFGSRFSSGDVTAATIAYIATWVFRLTLLLETLVLLKSNLYFDSWNPGDAPATIIALLHKPRYRNRQHCRYR